MRNKGFFISICISLSITNVNISPSLLDDPISVNSFSMSKFKIFSCDPVSYRRCQRVEFYLPFNNFLRWFPEIYVTIRLTIKCFYCDFGHLGFSRYRLGRPWAFMSTAERLVAIPNIPSTNHWHIETRWRQFPTGKNSPVFFSILVGSCVPRTWNVVER